MTFATSTVEINGSSSVSCDGSRAWSRCLGHRPRAERVPTVRWIQRALGPSSHGGTTGCRIDRETLRELRAAGFDVTSWRNGPRRVRSAHSHGGDSDGRATRPRLRREGLSPLSFDAYVLAHA